MTEEERKPLFTIYEDELDALRALPSAEIVDRDVTDIYDSGIPYSALEDLFWGLVQYAIGVPKNEISFESPAAEVLFAIKLKEINHD